MSQAKTILSLLAESLSGGSVRIVDLTQPLEPKTPVLQLPPQYAQNPPFESGILSEYDDRGPAWYWNWFKCGEHTGTHFDAPVHWITGKDHENNTTDTIPVDSFISPACVLDAVPEALKDPDFLVSPEFVAAWEDKYGQIPAGSWVLFRTDWSKRTDPVAFLNEDASGFHTPGWSSEAITFLLEERDIRGIGVETVGTDAGQGGKLQPAFPCHSLLHGANKYGLASLTNLDQLPPTGALIIAAPLKIVRGSGSPLRVLALIPNN
ncbi:cyclase [Kordiimonas sediminis]|uniref:Cyclase n=1 Tax=Kordiimonas sediminis TaxID=1735581 RepID=A0A919E4P3_9PROT|nr:cyclase family protein [Kordiimonas sediminis]GHF13492.1 cyclase [Kordiimonas sediminis]